MQSKWDMTMFSWLIGNRFFVVISLFSNLDRLNEAQIGEENPWAEIDPLYDENSDRIFLVRAGKRCLGHVRVFEYVGAASLWATSMTIADNVWAYWDMGQPIGPFGEDEQYKRAKQGAERVITFDVRAKNQILAAENALKILQPPRR